MFASRVGTNPKCVAHLPSLLEVVLTGKNTVNNPFVGLGHAVGVGLNLGSIALLADKVSLVMHQKIKATSIM